MTLETISRPLGACTRSAYRRGKKGVVRVEGTPVPGGIEVVPRGQTDGDA